MADISRTAWTIVADSECSAGYEAENCIDGNPATRWESGNDPLPPNLPHYPHWLAVDMQTPQTIDHIRFVCDTGFVPNPEYVQLYLSDNGIDWGTAVASAVWPSDKREQWIYITNSAGNLDPRTTRHFKLVGVQRMQGVFLTQMSCQEIYAGKLEAGDSYKRYWKAHPKSYADLAVDTGEIDYNGLELDAVYPANLQLAHAIAQLRVFRFSPEAFYPEIVSSLYDLPLDWPDTPNLETMSAVLEGDFVHSSTYTAALTAKFTDIPAQGYFDFLYQWYFGTAAFSTPRSDKLWDADEHPADEILPEDIPVEPDEAHPDLFSHVYVWGSILGDTPNHTSDVERLTVTDRYLLLVFPAIYTPPVTPPVIPPPVNPPPGAGSGTGNNTAMLLLDLSPSRGGVA